jgi:two-component system, OmpR family, sensor kinase
LLAGANQLSAGNFDARIGLRGTSEIAEIATVLDEMATKVALRERGLAEQNAALELAVAARTETLAQLLAEAKTAEEGRRQMLADVSHELRTPLTIIQGESDVALRGAEKTPAEYREALTRARDAAAHTATLVNDLLFVARSEVGRVRLNLEDCNLHDLVAQAARIVDRKIHVFHDLKPMRARVDPLRLRQAVIALVQNARLHGGGDIRVRAIRISDGYRIAVEDNGPGMSEADREQAFDRFFRGSNAAETYGEGTGLGLPVVRAIALAHGGTARLEAHPEGGTIAIIDLPKAPTDRSGS